MNFCSNEKYINNILEYLAEIEQNTADIFSIIYSKELNSENVFAVIKEIISKLSDLNELQHNLSSELLMSYSEDLYELLNTRSNIQYILLNELVDFQNDVIEYYLTENNINFNHLISLNNKVTDLITQAGMIELVSYEHDIYKIRKHNNLISKLRYRQSLILPIISQIYETINNKICDKNEEKVCKISVVSPYCKWNFNKNTCESIVKKLIK